ncbi:hypothetical protein HK099_001507, partial [Clydaea vesicula]
MSENNVTTKIDETTKDVVTSDIFTSTISSTTWIPPDTTTIASTTKSTTRNSIKTSTTSKISTTTKPAKTTTLSISKSSSISTTSASISILPTSPTLITPKVSAVDDVNVGENSSGGQPLSNTSVIIIALVLTLIFVIIGGGCIFIRKKNHSKKRRLHVDTSTSVSEHSNLKHIQRNTPYAESPRNSVSTSPLFHPTIAYSNHQNSPRPSRPISALPYNQPQYSIEEMHMVQQQPYYQQQQQYHPIEDAYFVVPDQSRQQFRYSYEDHMQFPHETAYPVNGMNQEEYYNFLQMYNSGSLSRQNMEENLNATTNQNENNGEIAYYQLQNTHIQEKSDNQQISKEEQTDGCIESGENSSRVNENFDTNNGIENIDNIMREDTVDQVLKMSR